MSTREKIIYLIDKIDDSELDTVCKVVEKFAFAHGEVPNDDTIEALAETEEMEKSPEKYKGYTDIDEMMRELLA